MAARARARGAGTRKSVRGSTTGRPIMALFDLFGRRWTLRVLWELRDGPRTFRGLRDAMEGVSPSVLNERLRDLREADLVEHVDGEGYGLTKRAVELSEQLLELDGWARKWARRKRP